MIVLYFTSDLGWGRREGGGGGVLAARRGGGSLSERGGCTRPTTTTCIPQGGVCVWGHGGIEVYMR